MKIDDKALTLRLRIELKIKNDLWKVLIGEIYLLVT